MDQFDELRSTGQFHTGRPFTEHPLSFVGGQHIRHRDRSGLDQRGDTGDSRGVEQGTHVDLDAEFGTQLRHQPIGKQRVTAEFEE